MCESPKAVTTEGTTNCYTKADARGHFRFRFLYPDDHLDHDRSRRITRSYSFRTKRNDSPFDLKAASCMRERNHFCHRSNHSITLSSLRPFAQSDRSNVSASPCFIIVFLVIAASHNSVPVSLPQLSSCIGGGVYVCAWKEAFNVLRFDCWMRMNG